MKTTTNIYRQDKYVRSEKACTLKEWVEMGRLAPGQSILIGDVKDNIGTETHSNTETIIIGHATPYEEPTTSSEQGWDYNNPRMSKTVLEVRQFD